MCVWARAGSVLSLAANVVCMLSVMVQPYMPNVSKQMQEQLQVREKLFVLLYSEVKIRLAIPHLQYTPHNTSTYIILLENVTSCNISCATPHYTSVVYYMTLDYMKMLHHVHSVSPVGLFARYHCLARMHNISAYTSSCGLY